MDFSPYRTDFLEQRIRLRMTRLRLLEPERYLEALEQRPSEAKALMRELLVGVTGSFRDGDLWETLRRRVLPSLVRNRPLREPIRVWVPGCATGEEAYSLAVLLQEFLEEAETNVPVQLFGTDLDEEALAAARTGVYEAGIESQLTPELLHGYFRRVPDGFQAKRFLREMCVFVRHDLIRDPPFPRLDLISCRSLLQYLGAACRQKVLAMFQAALRPGGALLLDPAEVTAEAAGAFETPGECRGLFLKPRGSLPPAPEAVPPRASLEDPTGHRPERYGPGESTELRQELLLTTAYLRIAAEQHQALTGAVKAARTELDHLERIFQSLKVPILRVNRDLAVTRFNEAAGEALGIGTAHLGKPLDGLRPASGLPDLPELAAATIRGAGVQQREVQDTAGCRYSITAWPCLDAAGAVQGAILNWMPEFE